MPGPLSGIRVVDLTQMVAGPICTLMLGDFGADVIKVEPPEGDALRKTGDTSVGGSGESEGFISVNRNKRSLVADLKTERGLQIVKGLAANADIFIENFRPGVAERLGLGYAALSAANPGLIYASVPGYSSTGRDRDRPAVDQVMQALSGIMQLTGTAESGPLRTGFPYADMVTPLIATIGVLAALQARHQSGVGQQIELPMLNATIFGMMPREGHYFATGNTPGLYGNGSYLVAPCNTYPTSDGRQIMVMAHVPKFWDALLAALDAEDLKHDPRFRTNSSRIENRAALDAALGAAFARRPLAEWLPRLEAANALAVPVRIWPEVFGDPEVKREMLVEVEHPTAGRITVLANPLRFSKTPAEVRRPPPLLGQHNAEIEDGEGWLSTDPAG